MTNSEIRAWYQRRVAEISELNQEWTAQGISLEERARRAWHVRHEARIAARTLMENAAEIEDLRKRDLRLYGDTDGPTFDQLVQDNLRRGYLRDEAYDRIISGAQSTNREVNKLFESDGPS